MPAKKVSHGDTEVTERGPDAANVERSPAFHSLQTPFEYEYEYRCAEYEYEKVRESAFALLSVLLRALRVSVRGFFRDAYFGLFREICGLIVSLQTLGDGGRGRLRGLSGPQSPLISW